MVQSTKIVRPRKERGGRTAHRTPRRTNSETETPLLSRLKAKRGPKPGTKWHRRSKANLAPKNKRSKKKKNPWDSGSSDGNPDVGASLLTNHETDTETDNELSQAETSSDVGDSDVEMPTLSSIVHSDMPDISCSREQCDSDADSLPVVRDSDLANNKKHVRIIPAPLNCFESEVEESESDQGTPPSLKHFDVEEWEEQVDKTCSWLEDRPKPDLSLPQSSEDLLLNPCSVSQAIEVHEFCRRFGFLVNLWPFTFEDFCACLAYRHQSALLDEIHIRLLRCLMRDDDSKQISYGPHDSRESIALSTFLLDKYTYGEVLRRYLESDSRFEHEPLEACSNVDYPFVEPQRRLIVLRWLCHQTQTTAPFKSYVDDEGRLTNEDHCRDCGKPGELLCCDSCVAVYHFGCLDPPLKEPPGDDWQCPTCSSCRVEGVVDFNAEKSKKGFVTRYASLGYDRHGRRYWFAARRLFIEDDASSEVWYYSTLPQLYELLSSLDPLDYERQLCGKIVDLSDEIIQEMELTCKLTEQRKPKGVQKTWIDHDTSGKKVSPPTERNFDTLDKNLAFAVESANAFCSLLKKIYERVKQADSDDAKGGQEPDRKLRSKTSMPDTREHFELDFFTGCSQIDQNMPPLFKLGMERNYTRYDNEFSSNSLNISPYLRADDHRIEKYIASKFCLDEKYALQQPNKDTSIETREDGVKTIQLWLNSILDNFPIGLLHPLWSQIISAKWKQDLAHSSTPADLADLLSRLEANMKQIAFCEIWRTALGLTKLCRQTIEDKEELKNREKQKKMRRQREREETFDLSDRRAQALLEGSDDEAQEAPVIWVKYSLTDGPPKHELWKLKDEWYRVSGIGQLGGWIWCKANRTLRHAFSRNNAWQGGVAWQFEQSSVVEKLLDDVRRGDLSLSLDASAASSAVSQSGHPSCAELPMDFNENTLEFEINRPLAVQKLQLYQHAFSFNVSLALTQHSLYYKMGHGSKFLDTLLLARMNQADQESPKIDNTASNEPIHQKAPPHACYARRCGASSGDSSRQSSYKCYSYACRVWSSTCQPESKNSTQFIHRLALDRASKQNMSSKDSQAWQPFHDSNCKSPVVHKFRSSRSANPNILVLPRYYARRLARNIFALNKIEGFSVNSKSVAVVWPYPCIRPYVNTCWKYQATNVQSLHAVALLLRILHASVQWSAVQQMQDLNACFTKMLPSGVMEIRQLIGHKFLPPYGLMAKYYVRVMGGQSNKMLYESDEEDEVDEVKAIDKRGGVSLNRVYQNKETSSIDWMEETALTVWEVRNYWLNELSQVKKKKQQQPKALEQNQISGENANITPISGDGSTQDVKALTASKPTPKLASDLQAALQGSKIFVKIKGKDGVERLQQVQARLAPQVEPEPAPPKINPKAELAVVKTPISFISRRTLEPPKKPIFEPFKSRIDENGEIIEEEDEAKRANVDGNVDAEAPSNDDELDDVRASVRQVIRRTLFPSRGQEPTFLDWFADEIDDAEGHFDGFGIDGQPLKRRRRRRRRRTRLEMMAAAAAAAGQTGPVFHDYTDAAGPRAKPDLPLRKPRKRRVSSLETDAASKRPRRSMFDDLPKDRASLDLWLPPNTSPVDRILALRNKKHMHHLRRLYVEQERRLRTEVAALVNEMVSKVCKAEAEETQLIKRLEKMEERRNYVRQYVEKRKTGLRLEQKLGNAISKWRREVGKRRAIMQELSFDEAQADLDNGELDELIYIAKTKRIRLPRELAQRAAAVPPPTWLSASTAKSAKKPPPYSVAKKSPQKTSPPTAKRTPKPKGDALSKLSNLPKSTPSEPTSSPSFSSSSPSSSEESSTEESTAETEEAFEPISAAPKVVEKTGVDLTEQLRKPDTSCLCNRPYDSTKFYIGCDLCLRYFHGKCVGVTSNVAKRLTSWYCPECQRERQNAKHELYCICRTPYDESQFYISCDLCDLWFHGRCVGVEPEEGEEISEFVCPDCARSRENGGLQPMTKRLDFGDFRRMTEVVTTLDTHKMSWPFRHAVNPQEHPAYGALIQEQMDLSILRRKVENRQYSILMEFSNDVSLIFNNARKYYAPDSPEFQCATVLDRFFSDRLHELKKRIVGDSNDY